MSATTSPSSPSGHDAFSSVVQAQLPLRISTVEQGTAYEEHTQAFLKATFRQMDLMRVGGANDGGIDLTGWWWSPLHDAGSVAATADVAEASQPPRRIRVSVQCKSEARKLGPIHVREMRGAMKGIRQDELDLVPSSMQPRADPTAAATPSMAILASSSGFSKQCLLQALAAPFPLLLIHLLYPSQQDAAGLRYSQRFACPTIAANDALLKGLLRSQLEVRFVTTMANPKPPGGRGRPPSPVKVDMPALFLGGQRLG